MKYLVLLTVLFSTPIMADVLTWAWEPPTAREDNTPLAPEEIAGYGFMLNGAVQVDAAGLPILLIGGENNLILEAPLGEQCAQFNTVDVDGRESVFTDPREACKIAKGLPGKPVNLTVTIVRPKRNP